MPVNISRDNLLLLSSNTELKYMCGLPIQCRRIVSTLTGPFLPVNRQNLVNKRAQGICSQACKKLLDWNKSSISASLLHHWKKYFCKSTYFTHSEPSDNTHYLMANTTKMYLGQSVQYMLLKAVGFFSRISLGSLINLMRRNSREIICKRYLHYQCRKTYDIH